MITNTDINFKGDFGEAGDRALGNILFRIASIIGIATHNGYDYGFPKWRQQHYFVNQLPVFEGYLKRSQVPKNFQKMDFGFTGFGYRDGINLIGELGSYKYFDHCRDLIKSYFTLRPQCEPYKDCILIHYRNYNNPAWANLSAEYYKAALKHLPKKTKIVVTDNIEVAYKILGPGYEYTSNTPIIDFYLLCNADYLVMANSTFSWWGAFLSGAETVAPSVWYDGVLKNAPTNDLYLPNWIII